MIKYGVNALGGRIGYWLVFCLLAFRLFYFTSEYSIDLFFNDQWSYLTTSLYPNSLVNGFLTPLGPHRIGLGFFLFKMTLASFDYNNRAIAFMVAGFILINALLFTWLKERKVGKITLIDIYIPLVFFNLHQYAILLNNPNISIHQLVFSILMFIVLLFRGGMPPWKFVLLYLLTPLIGFTGNGFFVVIALTIFSLILSIKEKSKRYWWLALSLSGTLTLITYLQTANYAAMDCGASLNNSASYFFRFLQGMTLNGLLIAYSPSTLKAIMFVVLLLIGAGVVIKKLIHSHCANELSPLIIIIYTGLFICATTIGRWCFGLPITESSRYVPHIALGYLAFALWFKSNRSISYNLFALLMSLFFIMGIGKFYKWKQPIVEVYSHNMKEWKDCYVTERDAKHCNESLQFQPYPGDIGPIKLEEKLERLSQLNPSFRKD